MESFDFVDLDNIIDYRAEYAAVIQNYTISGTQLVGFCPFHEDRKSSFSVDLETGKWYCFSEDLKGNFISFWAMLHNTSNAEAYKTILQKYGIAQEKPKPKQKQSQGLALGSYSIEQYSTDKQLPIDFLQEVCKVSTGGKTGGITYLKMPYLKADGKEATYRKRFANKEFRWAKDSKGKICLYGEWRIEKIREKGRAILVEGESDTQSLWYMGFPALGIAGASMFKPEQAEVLQGLKLYIHKEPDQGGETFTKKLFKGLKDGGFTGSVYLWECSELGAKDPSQIYMEKGRTEGREAINSLLANAKPVDLGAELIPDVIPGAPIKLRQAKGFIYSDEGIGAIRDMSGVTTLVCRTPIILTKRLKSIETGDERVEIAFKRDGKWHTAIFPRSTVFSSRKITELSDLGCTVTSENAKQIVRFLGALEAENIDVIPKNDSTSTFGWQPGKRFLPGHDEGITLDIDPSQRGMAAAYHKSGTLEGWTAAMTPHRARERFRFILVAGFAAPLLRIVKQRIFFVYNWGDSKGGKTAALKAALSAWGDPERLMVSFNTTQVGLERTAAFCCDLPLGIDERQLAGSKQESLEKLVYMIASGSGKVRGSKTGGIQATQQWRTVALATGEEPLSTETSQTGISTRVLEIYGGPFENEADAGEMHRKVSVDYGTAGPEFIKYILQTGEREITERYEQMQSFVKAISKGKNGSHISGISVVALADAMIDRLFFGGTKETAWEAAKAMAENILLSQVENNAADVNENAVQFIVDWILSNKLYFTPGSTGTCYGFIEEARNTAYIFPTILNQALTKAGYKPRKTIRYMAERGLIRTTKNKDGTTMYSVVKWFENRSTRFVEFDIGKADSYKADDDSNNLDDLDDFPF